MCPVHNQKAQNRGTNFNPFISNPPPLHSLVFNEIVIYVYSGIKSSIVFFKFSNKKFRSNFQHFSKMYFCCKVIPKYHNISKKSEKSEFSFEISFGRVPTVCGGCFIVNVLNVL